MNAKKRPAFGQKVYFTDTVSKERVCEIDLETDHRRAHAEMSDEVYKQEFGRDYTSWIHCQLPKDEPRRSGIYVGYRIVYSGYWESESFTYWGEADEDPPARYFKRQTQHEVWLIVPSERENMVRVFAGEVYVPPQEEGK
jgi:hypothetical protein